MNKYGIDIINKIQPVIHFNQKSYNQKKSATKATLELYQQIREKVWHVYHGNTKRFFSKAAF